MSVIYKHNELVIFVYNFYHAQTPCPFFNRFGLIFGN